MTTTDAFLESGPRGAVKNPLLRSDELPPVLLVGGIAALVLVWNLFAGLSYTVSLFLILLGPAACFALFAFYRLVRPDEKIAQSALYMGLWLFYPAFGAQLVFLATTLNFPLRDQSYFAFDRALGFDWMSWARFVLAHPLFKTITDIAYSSCFWQPLAGILIFAIWGPARRNAELITSVMLGLLAVVAIYAVAPSIGPADSQHINATGQIVQTLRSGFKGPYAYVGVIPFPSFHTVMAILFTLAFRNNRWLFTGFGILNLAMLCGVPFQGDHYLCDMLAGAAIAAAAFFATRWLYQRI